MTAILGLEHDGSVYIAGERMWSGASDAAILARPKVWLSNGIAWGCSGKSRLSDLIRYASRPLKPPRTEIGAFVVTELIPWVRDLARSDGIEESFTEDDFGALVGIRGELWTLAGPEAERSAEGYASTGNNDAASLVGLACTAGKSPTWRLRKVMAAMSKHVPGVGGRVDVVNT